ncbi:MAG: hypothetical protein U0798_21175 [Gemmataceae bacterium]
MSISPLQEPFFRDISATFKATHERILHRLRTSAPSEADSIIEDELRGLYHGLFVIFDGGTVLADEGLVKIVDEDGIAFVRHLHELCFKYWPIENRISN